MNLLYQYEVAAVVAEIGVFGWPSPGTAANTPVAETTIGTLGSGPNAIAIGAVTLGPSAALVANNANYATISVFKRTAGGAPVLLASVTTQVTGSGSWVAWTPVKLNVVAGAFVSPGDVITASITQTGTGAPQISQFQLVGFTTTQ